MGGSGLHAIDTEVRGPTGGLRAWQAPDVAGSMNFTDDAPMAAVLERWYHARGGDAVGPNSCSSQSPHNLYVTVLHFNPNDQNPTVNSPFRTPEGAQLKRP